MTTPSTDDGLTIIAETGASHGHSYAKCLALIHAARLAGADAVKFSAFKADEMTADSQEPPFLIANGPWKGRSLYNLYKQSALPYEWLPDIKRAAQSAGLKFILSIYHPNTVPLLAELGVRTVKIASFELNFPDFLQAVAQSSVSNVIASTGSSTIPEIEQAVRILSNKHLTLLHCVSAYPALPEEMNLHTMIDMQIRFKVPVGLSDHTTGMNAPVCAGALGASVIEKHIKIDEDGLDSSFAILPDRFAGMVQVCRQAKTMLGKAVYDRPKAYHRKQIKDRMLRVVW